MNEDTKAIVASNFTIAKAILVTSGWGVANKEQKYPPPDIMIGEWFEAFLHDLK
jgi:hypothetical protein